jgi:broad specificity phosphatase PhoE
MQPRTKNRRNLIGFLLVASVPLCAASWAGVETNATPHRTAETTVQELITTVFLVRHAEKAGPGDPEFAGASPSDPPLNASGVARAEELVRTLDEAGVTAIYSSPYERTRATVRPLAERFGLEVTEHAAADIAGLVERIRADNRGGFVVVAGHSNTVPALVEALGAGAVPPIEEAWEYDNLYIVTTEARGRARVSTLKYGARSRPRAGW